MGAFTELEVAGYPLCSTKSAVDLHVMTIFRESDRRVESRLLSERNPLIWGDSYSGKDELETVVFYSCKVEHIRDRLDVMGFTLARVRRDFESLRKTEIDEFATCEEESVQKMLSAQRDLLIAIDFETYAAALGRVIENKLRPLTIADANRTDLDAATKYILGQDDDYCLGFFCADVRSLIRLACDLVDAEADVVQDITDLIEAGYYEPDEPVCTNAVAALTSDHPENASRIILTEGSTDREFLEGSLQLLYPHLAGYYAFLDYAGTRSQGGAGHLASLVKAFAAAGITDRIIAVFDNDTASVDARRPLEQVNLPGNIAVLTYPDLDFLRSYPTLGPGGPSALDVNGLAASLELYLGRDVLHLEGSLIPVQWKGYSEAAARYQGEVMQKGRIQAAFREKLARCKDNLSARDEADWSGLRAILESIFNAFR